MDANGQTRPGSRASYSDSSEEPLLRKPNADEPIEHPQLSKIRSAFIIASLTGTNFSSYTIQAVIRLCTSKRLLLAYCRSIGGLAWGPPYQHYRHMDTCCFSSGIGNGNYRRFANRIPPYRGD
ncbi:predicted protein [Uncinocarpus reesii 1704]|uniref:Uncharacterized protein n=1 Tax=Uncinocarpus reesii (strain UAMH 1704) TaxID=336963 RepID=C4JI82_UNCRE|nr:uncharacterized protein UREG_02828 [Uncinocarpus reesii 1704]EEP77979.1 predicted protein [Uncinocarpus reesii 1704]